MGRSISTCACRGKKRKNCQTGSRSSQEHTDFVLRDSFAYVGRRVRPSCVRGAFTSFSV